MGRHEHGAAARHRGGLANAAVGAVAAGTLSALGAARAAALLFGGDQVRVERLRDKQASSVRARACELVV